MYTHTCLCHTHAHPPVVMADEGEEREEGVGDPRLEILKQYTLKTMKQVTH